MSFSGYDCSIVYLYSKLVKGISKDALLDHLDANHSFPLPQ